MNWYFAVEGNSQGPVSEQRLAEIAREGRVTTDTLIWHPGLEEWEPVWKLKPEIVEHLNKSAMAQQAKGETARIPVSAAPQPEKAGRGIFKRLFGWGKKN